MAIRQPKTAPARSSKKVSIPTPSSSGDESSAENHDEPDEEIHTGSEDEDASLDDEGHIEQDHKAEIEEEVMEYHTDPEDGSDEDDPAETVDYTSKRLPLELLKSKPAEGPVQPVINWDKLTRKEKKELRDDMGISMRELREEALKTGALQAGRAAQFRRGVRPAEKVAGSRIAKKSRKKKDSSTIKVSGKQQMIEQRRRAEELRKSGKGSLLTGRRRNKG